MSDFDEPLDGEEELPKSKTQIKQEMLALQDYGRALMKLSDSDLVSLALPTRLLEALREARRIKHHEGLRRQMQFIGRLMRENDHQAIIAKYEKLNEKDRQRVQRLQLVEKWRDRLLDSSDKQALTELISSQPDCDVQHLRALVRSAQKDAAQGKPPAHARKLFRYLRELLDA